MIFGTKKTIFLIVLLAVFIFPRFSSSALSPSSFNLHDGDLISAIFSSDPDVYIINDSGYKRIFLNPEIFKFYKHLGGFANVKLVTPEIRDAFPTSGLFRNCEKNDQKVYGFESNGEDKGKLRWVDTPGDQAVKDDPDFFKKVFCINDKEFKWYPKGQELKSVKEVPEYHRVVPKEEEVKDRSNLGIGTATLASGSKPFALTASGAKPISPLSSPSHPLTKPASGSFSPIPTPSIVSQPTTPAQPAVPAQPANQTTTPTPTLTPTPTSTPTPTPITSNTTPIISNLQVTNITTTSAVFTWTTDQSTTSYFYPITASLPGGTSATWSAQLSESLVTSHSVTVTGLVSATTFTYRVASRNSRGYEAISDIKSFVTPGSTPTPTPPTTPSSPTSVNAALLSIGQIALTWPGTPPNYYKVFRSTNGGGYVILNLITNFNYNDFSGLTSGSTYSYKVVSCDVNWVNCSTGTESNAVTYSFTPTPTPSRTATVSFQGPAVSVSPSFLGSIFKGLSRFFKR